jgi:hypothetical protein
VSPLGWLDHPVVKATDNFIIHGWSPFLNLAFFIGLVVVWIGIPLFGFLTRHFLSATKRAFFDQFNDSENARARHAFRFGLWEAYLKFKPGAKPSEFATLIDNITWPREKRSDESPLAYVESINWPNVEGQQFWEFCERVFRPVYDGSNSELISEEKLKNLIEGCRAVAKFWDAWANQIEERFIGVREVQDAIRGNRIDIKAVAIVEIYNAKIGWDRGRGKMPLFKLARDHLSFGPERWGKRLRRYAGSKLRIIATRIETNG